MASKNSSNNVFNVSKEASDLATDDKVQEEERRHQEQGPTLLVANPTAVVTVAPDGDTSHYQSSDISDTSAQVLMISMSVFSVIVLIVIVTGCSIGNT